MTIRIPVSIGELVDKLTILEIKKFKITEQEKKSKIIKEYGLLQEVILESEVSKNIEYQQFYNNLKKINQELWEIEEQIRIFEKDKNFGLEFVDVARSVYRLNDKRFEIKNEINIFFGSEIAEQKEYEEY